MTTDASSSSLGSGRRRISRFDERSGFWFARSAAFILVCVLMLTRGSARHRGFELAILGAGGVFFVAWGAFDWRSSRASSPPRWLLTLALAGLGVVGGLGSALGATDVSVAFAVIASISGGSDASLGEAWAVTAAGILGAEVSGLLFGFSTSTALGLPLLLVAALLGGRYRRVASLKAEQAKALVAQMEQTHAEQRRAAALDERNRIAREIHDVLAHSLSALGIQIEAATSVLRDTGDIAASLRLLDHARYLADEGLNESQRAIHALRTDVAPLPESLAILVDSYKRDHRGDASLAVSGTVRALPPDATVTLLRIAQEALTNATKHARGSPLCVQLDFESNKTALTISNAAPSATNELPTPSAGDPGGGYGLVGMRERLLLLGGTLSAGPSEQGWTLRAEVPR
jgi:signal transduction histidine kinase